MKFCFHSLIYYNEDWNPEAAPWPTEENSLLTGRNPEQVQADTGDPPADGGGEVVQKKKTDRGERMET